MLQKNLMDPLSYVAHLLNLLNPVASSPAVVHDQHRSHLQPLEKQWNQMLRKWTTRFLWRHGMACQHQWCKSSPPSLMLPIFFPSCFDVYWHSRVWSCAIDVGMAGNVQWKKNTVHLQCLMSKMSFSISTWISLRNMTSISVLNGISICHRNCATAER